MSTHLPTDAQLTAALVGIKRDNPGFGVKKLRQELKLRFPAWQVSEKRVRAAVAATAPDSEDHDTDGGFEQHIAAFYALARSGVRPPVAQYYTKDAPALSVAMLRALGAHSSAFVYGLEAFRAPPDGADLHPDTDALYLPYRLFRAEWLAYLGPAGALLPAAPHADDVEAGTFPDLFPFGIGHYKNQPNLSFEQYAFHHLRGRDAGFRTNRRWLQWALTRTEDPDLVVALNCVLVVKHGVKCRHIGESRVQEVAAEDEFE
ncbi:hypothetical protein AURDEDRAFT_158872 [Auricularia subglabra TFB-10046 SS5]|nr:hypothetical protein AURDEDRAFT_158872 [Auricularia subglabra TFB-10046 SS5]